MTDELVFRVEGNKATAAMPISLAEAGLTERSDLQEWVISNPQMLGDGVLIVTFEFANWRSSSGNWEKDRLDVLGLDKDGRLVIAELKRGQAPDTVEMQALKYAAMASRFSPEDLATAHMKFLKSRKEIVDTDSAMERLATHSMYGLTTENLRRPRVVILAASFPAVLTATTVWLNEMGLEITLMRFQAYRTPSETVVTVSQLYPVRDVEDFTVAPARAGGREASKAPQLPTTAWTQDDFIKLRSMATNPIVLSALELCAASFPEAVSLRELEAQANRTPPQARADLAGLTVMVKKTFGRSNWPFQYEWNAGGDPPGASYRMTEEQANFWHGTAPEGAGAVPPAGELLDKLQGPKGSPTGLRPGGQD